MKKKINQQNRSCESEKLTYGEHLEVLRQLLFRILGVTGIIAVVIFYFKDLTWQILLAPSDWNFVSYRLIENLIKLLGFNEFHFEEFHVDLIVTELSSQFMTHITTAIYLGLLGASPYILYELFRFISPALYETERKYSVKIAVTIYVLFIIGVLMTYYILFPISFRFLGTYSIADRIHSSITLDSYITTFTSLTLVMGLVFQLPVLTFFLGKLGLVNSWMLIDYRRHAFFAIMLVSAIITPPDIITLILVTIPLYLLFEISIRVLIYIERNEEMD